MSFNSFSQKLLFPDLECESINQETSSTFVDNMKLPVHRWFRYSAGFSAQWVENAIAEAKGRGSVTVLDPFAGAGTTLLAAEKLLPRSLVSKSLGLRHTPLWPGWLRRSFFTAQTPRPILHGLMKSKGAQEVSRAQWTDIRP